MDNTNKTRQAISDARVRLEAAQVQILATLRGLRTQINTIDKEFERLAISEKPHC